MWQRVQTLYLALSTLLIALMFFCNKAVVLGPDGSEVEAYTYTHYVPYLILLIVITCLNVLALTTYKMRIFQMRTAVFSALITLALQGWLVVDFISNHNAMVFKISAIFPIVAIILDILAVKGIMADELLVQSVSHLRTQKKNRKI